MHLINSTLRLFATFVVTAALTIFAATAASAYQSDGNGQGNGTSDPGCVTGNPSTGSKCDGGNGGQAGGGVGCAGGSQADRAEPCGRGTGDGTLNNQGNVPGCTSQGDAVNQNPHCGGESAPPTDGNGNPPPADGNGNPPAGAPQTNAPQTSVPASVQVTSLPSTGA